MAFQFRDELCAIYIKLQESFFANIFDIYEQLAVVDGPSDLDIYIIEIMRG